MWGIFGKPRFAPPDLEKNLYSSRIYDDWKSSRQYETAVTNNKVLTREAIEKMAEMMEEMTKPINPYDAATKVMNVELEKKGLPKMEKIMEVFEMNCPEYFI